jgi:hypothetical protein
MFLSFPHPGNVTEAEKNKKRCLLQRLRASEKDTLIRIRFYHFSQQKETNAALRFAAIPAVGIAQTTSHRPNHFEYGFTKADATYLASK